MDHGKFYEPIEISNYEKCFKSNGYDIKVEPCGLVTDEQNYVLGPTPDGKVSFNDRGKMQWRIQKCRPKRCLLYI